MGRLGSLAHAFALQFEVALAAQTPPAEAVFWIVILIRRIRSGMLFIPAQDPAFRQHNSCGAPQANQLSHRSIEQACLSHRRLETPAHAPKLALRAKS